MADDECSATSIYERKPWLRKIHAAALASMAAKREEKAKAETAVCAKCKLEKPKECFGRAAHRPRGIRPYCKPCHNADTELWRSRNIERSRAASLAWQKRNPEKRRQKTNKSQRKIRATEIGRLGARIRNSVRWSVKNGKEGKKTFELLDFTLEELKRHLERQFNNGMSWPVFMTGAIHIDHIRPLSSFNITSPTCADFKQAWALSNLRPMWAQDNLKKSGKCLFLI